MKTTRLFIASLALLSSASAAAAQSWIEFSDVSSTDLIGAAGGPSLKTLGEIGSLDERSTSFVLADFNQDGLMDVAAFCKAPDFSSEGIGDIKPHILLMGTAPGRLEDKTISLAPDFINAGKSTARTAIAADLNGDGFPELIVPNTNGQNPDLYRNNGGIGSAWLGFTRMGTWYLTEGMHAKFTDDTEVVAGTATSAEMDGIGGLNAASVAAGDVDGDGDLDLLFGCYNSAFGFGRAQDAYLENLGNLRFIERTSSVLNMNAPNSLVMKVTLEDFDHDGRTDILMTNAFQQLCIQFNGGGNFTDPAFPPIFLPPALGLYDHTVADFNGDGWLDVFSNGDGKDRTLINTGTVPISFLGGGPGGQYLQSVPAGSGTDLLSGNPHAHDFDLDGVPDMGLSDMIKYAPTRHGCTDGSPLSNGGPPPLNGANPFLFLKGRVTDGSIPSLYDPAGSLNPPLFVDGVWDFAYWDGNLLMATCQGFRLFKQN